MRIMKNTSNIGRCIWCVVPVLLLFSCNTNGRKQQKVFDTNNPHLLEIQVQDFLDCFHSKDLGATTRFQTQEVLWRNVYFNGYTEGEPTVIPDFISLISIKDLNGLSANTIKIKGDTLKGFYSMQIEFASGDPWIHFMSNAISCIDTSEIEFILNEDGLIQEVIHKGYLETACFTMDEREINSNEYRSFLTDSVKEDSNNNDSIEKEKHSFNSYELVNFKDTYTKHFIQMAEMADSRIEITLYDYYRLLNYYFYFHQDDLLRELNKKEQQMLVQILNADFKNEYYLDDENCVHERFLNCTFNQNVKDSLIEIYHVNDNPKKWYYGMYLEKLGVNYGADSYDYLDVEGNNNQRIRTTIYGRSSGFEF